MVDHVLVGDAVELVGGHPGATALPASASAPAAMRPATRIFSMTSGSAPTARTFLDRRLPRVLGTLDRLRHRQGRCDHSGAKGTANWHVLQPNGDAGWPLGAADVDRPQHHPSGEHDMRGALGRRVLAAVARAAAVDGDVVDRGAGALGQPQVEGSPHQVEFDHHHRAGEPGVGGSRSTEPTRRTSASRSAPSTRPAAAASRASPELHPVGGRADDGARPGQVVDQHIEFRSHPRRGYLRRALLELADVDQPERHGVVQPPQCSVAVGVGNPQRGVCSIPVMATPIYLSGLH